MRAQLVFVVWLAAASLASAEPKATKVDLKPVRDALVVLQDGDGGTYVVRPYQPAADGKPAVEARVFFGTAGKELYEQASVGRSANGASWQQSTWAPRLSQTRPASLDFQDGSYKVWCDRIERPLTQLTGDKAKAVLDRSTFMTEFMVRRAHMLARDDAGVYYYIDRFAQKYGGKGYRVFVGKKGAMKQLDLTDIASDSAGEVFSTKTGDLRLTRSTDAGGGSTVVWIRGEKRTPLITLDVDVNSPVVWTELGIYKFLGTLCDNI